MARGCRINKTRCFLLTLCLAAVAFVLLAPKATFAASPARPAEARVHEPQVLDVPGNAPAYVFAPRSRNSRGLVVWMHGHGGNPHDDCIKWAHVATDYGWLLCPSGQEDTGGGRGWNNDWPGAQRVVRAAVDALRKQHPQIQKTGNVLIGFSEGAYAAMNIGVREPKLFSRWLILASCTRYWGAEGLELIQKNRRSIQRVYLLTGAQDGVVDDSRDAFNRLRHAKVRVRLEVVGDIGHEVPAARMRELYQKPLTWLVYNR